MAIISYADAYKKHLEEQKNADKKDVGLTRKYSLESETDPGADIILGTLFMNPARIARGVSTATGKEMSEGTKKALGWMAMPQEKLEQGLYGAAEGITDFVAGGSAQIVGQKDAAKWIYEHSWSRDAAGDGVSDEFVGDAAETKGYQIASDVISGIGNVTFQIAVGTLVGGALAAPVANGAISQAGARAIQYAPLFLSASGSGTAENMQKTGNLGWRENVGGLLKGGVEVATEIISPTGKIANRALLGKNAEGVGRYLVKHGIAKGMLIDFVEEAGEEGLSYILDTKIENALKISDEKISWSEAAYQAVIGGITGSLFGGVSDVSFMRQAKKSGATVYAKGEAAVKNKINEGLIEVAALKERGLNNDNVKLAEAALAKLSADDGKLRQSTKEYYLGLAEQMVMKEHLTEQYNALAKELVAKAKADPATAQSMADAFNALVNEAGGEGKYTAADFTNENSEAARIYVVAQMASDWLSPSLGENTVNAIMTDRGEEYTGDEQQKEAVRNLKDGKVLNYKIGQNTYAIITKQGGTNNYSIAYTTTEQMMNGSGEVMPVHKLSADDILGSGLDGSTMTNEAINAYIDAQREQKATQEQEKARQAAEEAEKKKDEKPSRSPAKTKKAERAEQRAKAKQAKTDATNAVERIVKKHFAFDKDGQYGTLGDKAKGVVADFMQKLKTAKAEYRDGIALSIADYLIDNVDMLDAMADGVSNEQREQLQILRSYMHRIDLSGLQAEIRHHFDKNNGINAVWGAPKGAKSVAVPPDTLGMELAEYGIQLQGENEADLFIQLVEKYRSLRDAVSEKAQRQSVRDGLSAEELSKLRNTIADEVKAAVGIESAPADVSLSPSEETTAETTGSEATPGAEETETKEATIEDLTSVEKRLIPDLGVDNSEFTKEEWTKARECVPNIDGLTRREQARVLTLVRTAQANGINEDYMKGLARLSSVYGFGVMFNSEIRSNGMAIRSDGMVIINPRGENATIGHEIWHTIDQTSKDGQAVFRADLVEKIRNLVGAKQFDEAKAEYKRAYEAQFKRAISEAELDGEATASVVGKYLSNMTLLKKLAATDYKLGRGLLAAIRRMKDKWTSAKAFAKENNSTTFAEYRKMTRIENLLMKELGNKEKVINNSEISYSVSSVKTKSGDLVALHNLSEDRLKKAIELGGFPMPSIAITKINLPHTGYGDITVVFGENTIDPEMDARNYVYDRDGWTPTAPKVDVKLATGKVDNLVSELKKSAGDKYYADRVFSLFDGRFRNNSGEYIVPDYDYNKEKIGQYAYENAGVLAAYLNENGVDTTPVYIERTVNLRYTSMPVSEARRLLARVGITQDMDARTTSEEKRAEIRKKFYEYQDETLLEKLNGKVSTDKLFTLDEAKRMNDTNRDGSIDTALFWLADETFSGNQQTVVDIYATLEMLQSKVESKEAFYNWIWEKFSKTFEKRGIDNDSDIFDRRGNRRSFEQRHYDYTIENVIRAMKKGEQTGTGVLFGGVSAGSLAAKLSRQFDSISSIREAQDYLARVSEEDMKAFEDKTYELFDEVVSEIAGKSGDLMNDMTRRDDVGQILAKCAEASPLTVANIKRVFERETQGYNLNYKFDGEIAKKVLSLFQTLENVPTMYFEAKPRRAVGLSEIKMVEIPNTASKDLRTILAKNNIPFEVYGETDEQRTRAISNLSDVSFSPAPVSSATDSEGNVLSANQQQFFAKSKVRDANGRLLAVYHGTDADFDTFDLSRAGKNGRAEGFGFYFAANQEITKKYGDKQKKVYLNIEKPLYQDHRTVTKTELRKFVNALVEYQAEEYGDDWSDTFISDYVYTKNVSKAVAVSQMVDKIWTLDATDQDLIYDIANGSGANHSVDTIAPFYDILYKSTGYDGNISTWEYKTDTGGKKTDTIYVAFRPESAKYVTNTEPTKNTDLRYSPAEQQRRVVTRAQMPKPGITEKITNAKGQLNRRGLKNALDNASSAWESFKIVTVNAQQALENQLIRGGMTKRQAAAWSQLARTGRLHASNAIGYALADMTGEVRSDGLMKIITPFLAQKGEVYKAWDEDQQKFVDVTAKGGELAGKRYDDFSDYLAMLNAIDREKVGKNPYSDMTVGQMQKIVAEYEKANPDFKAASEQFSQYNNVMLDILVQSGMVSQELADKFRKKYPHYIPMRTADSTPVGSGAIRGSENLEVKRGLRTAEESNHRVDDPIKNYITQVESRIKAAKLNMLAIEIYETADGVNVVRGQDSRATAKELRAMEKQFLEDPLSMPDPTELFRKFQTGDNTRNEITFYKDGKMLTMAVSDRIYTGFTDLAGQHSAILDSNLAKLSKKINDTFKKLVTNWNPFFAVRNIARDLQDGLLQTQYGFFEFQQMYLKNAQMMASGKFNDLWVEFVANGGLESSLFSDEFATYTIGGKSGLEQAHGVVGQFQHIKNFNTLTEALPRFTEYCLTRKHGGSVQTALLNAADVTVNFGRGGTLTKILNSTVSPFLNPAVQGLDRVVRLFTENGLRNNKALASLLLKAFLLGILPMVLSNAMYGGDKEYEDMKDNVKENNYLFKIGNTWLKIPRGRVVSTISGLYNRSSKQVTGQYVDWADYGKNVLDQITPAQNVARHIASPFVDVANNKTWYGSAIESQSLQNYAVKDRYDENTSRIAVWIGQFTSHFGYSPKKVHYLLDQYSGVVGDILLPATTPAGTRGVVAYNFTVDANTSSNLSERFYKVYNEAMYAANAGDEEAYYLKKRLDETKSAVAELFKEIKTINADSSLSNKEKVQQASAIRAMINQLYKTAVQDAKGYAANVKDALAINGSYEVVQITQKNAKQYGLTSSDVGKYAVTFGGQSVKLYGSESEANGFMTDASKKTIYAEANRLTYGSEYALKEYNSNVYEKAQKLNELGISYDEYYNYYMTVRYYSGKDKKQKILAYLNGSGMSKSQIALMMYYSGYSAYKEDAKKAINASNLSAERKKELLAGLTE